MTAELKLRHRIWIILIRKHATRCAYTHRFLSSGHIADMEENFFLQEVLHFCDEGRSKCTSCILPKANTILAQTTARLRQRPELSSRDKERSEEVRREALAEGRHPGRSCPLRHRHSSMMHHFLLSLPISRLCIPIPHHPCRTALQIYHRTIRAHRFCPRIAHSYAWSKSRVVATLAKPNPKEQALTLLDSGDREWK